MRVRSCVTQEFATSIVPDARQICPSKSSRRAARHANRQHRTPRRDARVVGMRGHGLQPRRRTRLSGTNGAEHRAQRRGRVGRRGDAHRRGASALALVQRVLTGARYNRAFVAWQGREIAGYTREGIERWPDALGAASVTRFVTHAAIAAATARLAEATGLTGFAGAAYIVDAASGQACIIEINRRIVPATHAGRFAGVDLAAAFMSAVRGVAWSGPTDTPAELQRTMALFPQEWLRDRSGAS
jgi:hypothetical protein